MSSVIDRLLTYQPPTPGLDDTAAALPEAWRGRFRDECQRLAKQAFGVVIVTHRAELEAIGETEGWASVCKAVEALVPEYEHRLVESVDQVRARIADAWTRHPQYVNPQSQGGH